MKKLIKKLLTMACSLILCVLLLSGCSWLKIDNNRYYNQVVVSIGDHDFYKKDLIEAFNNYGYQYYESYGYTLEESVNYTIGSMIDRWLLLENVKSNPKYKVDEPEYLEIKQEAFEYMQDSIFTFEDQVRTEWDMKIEGGESSEEKTPLRAAEEEYTPSTYYSVVLDRVETYPDDSTKEFYKGVVTRSQEFEVEEDYTIEKEIEGTDDTKTVTYYKVVEEVHNHTHVEVDDSITKDTHFNKSKQIITDKKVSDEAWTRYVKSLQDQAKSEGRSTKEADVLLHEEKRLETLIENNRYLEKYEHDFYANLPVDSESILTYFRTQYKEQKEKFSAKESLYHTAMESASSEYVYYHHNSGNEYVNVKHILIKFNDAQTEAVKMLNTEFGVTNDGSDEDEERKQNAVYKAKMQKIVNQTTSTFEMDGETKTWNALVSSNDEYSVLEYVQEHVTGSTLAERAAQFNELMYIFNDDEGSMNSEFDYVVNLDTNVTDKMVKPFADGVRALDKSNGGDGAGSMDYIISEYGIHIIFHAGNAVNLIEDKNIDNINDEELLRILCNTYTTPESNKSIFNLLFDKLKLDETAYDTKSQLDIYTIRTEMANNGVVIKYYEDNYKDLWK